VTQQIQESTTRPFEAPLITKKPQEKVEQFYARCRSMGIGKQFIASGLLAHMHVVYDPGTKSPEHRQVRMSDFPGVSFFDGPGYDPNKPAIFGVTPEQPNQFVERRIEEMYENEKRALETREEALDAREAALRKEMDELKSQVAEKLAQASTALEQAEAMRELEMEQRAKEALAPSVGLPELDQRIKDEAAKEAAKESPESPAESHGKHGKKK
jgi:hypothetical protein